MNKLHSCSSGVVWELKCPECGNTDDDMFDYSDSDVYVDFTEGYTESQVFCDKCRNRILLRIDGGKVLEPEIF